MNKNNSNDNLTKELTNKLTDNLTKELTDKLTKEDEVKVVYITAIYGNYETSCKNHIKQTTESDFICFTDNENIINNGWIIDTNPYHLTNKSLLDNDKCINSISNNKHTFNIAKYYKQNFYNIERLKKYDVVIWLDGTIEIINDNTSKYILDNIKENPIIGWSHEYRNGFLIDEVIASDMIRYTSTKWNNQEQPYQNVHKQYIKYLKDGYKENYWDEYKKENKNMGVWITCFVAFDNKNKDILSFLELWHIQTLMYTTQDQISFPYVCQKLNIIPYTLPNIEIKGEFPHKCTDFYIKHNHGK